jgi:hypothetical protein
MNAIILALFSVCKAVVSASEFEFATEVPSSSSAAANYNNNWVRFSSNLSFPELGS